MKSISVLLILKYLFIYVYSMDDDRRPTVCNLPIESGICDNVVYRYSYKQEKMECIRYAYLGCGGNANQFDTMSECRKTCETNRDFDSDRRPTQCNLPIENYVCDGTIRKYVFRVSKSQCERIIYSGCGGNANLFDTMSECRKTCEVSGTRPHQCNLPVHTGDADCSRGRSDYVSFSEADVSSSTAKLKNAFDVDKSQCVRFTYLGCHGNANRFDTLQECRKTCEVNSR